jgi:hypothetical protein
MSHKCAVITCVDPDRCRDLVPTSKETIRTIFIKASICSAIQYQGACTIARPAAERSPHPDATDLYFQGLAFANKGITPEYMTKARSFFERALTLDPKNIEALVGTASIDLEWPPII